MLDRLGYDERWKSLFAPSAARGFGPGRVTRVDRGYFLLMTEAGVVRAAASTRLQKAAGPSEFPAVGDWVAIRPAAENGGSPLIEEVLPRASAFLRADPGKATAAQVLAANIDWVFLVQSLSLPPDLRRLEREMVLALESGASPVVVLTKADLCSDVGGAVAAVRAAFPGTPVHAVSNVTGAGVNHLATYAGFGRTAALLGASGVGKSTLINRLVGRDVQNTQEVRESDGKGRHTTVARELVQLPTGGSLIDTPGMRALALWEADDGMAEAFADVQKPARSCRFRDCTHVAEPGCAVLAAVADGSLPLSRLESFRVLAGELAALQAKNEARRRRRGGARARTVGS